MKSRLIKLYPDQISRFWFVLKDAIKAGLPLETDVDMNRVLTALLDGSLECFVFAIAEDDESVSVRAVVTTMIQKQIGYEGKTLFMYSLYGFQNTGKYLVRGLQQLFDYARSIGCNRVAGITNIEAAAKFVELTGGNANAYYVEWRI